jgi:cephalosporin hydroxylase
MVRGDTTQMETREVVKSFMKRGERIGLIFLDSTHDGTTPLYEYGMYQDLFADECLVVCDDLLAPDHLKEMQDFWEWLPGEKQILHYLHPRLNKDYPVPGFGISIVRREDA